MAKAQSQHEQRRAQTFKDQHGRGWWASVEKTTGHPSEPLRAGSWAYVGGAALVPIPQHYIILNPDEISVLRIDYDRWRADLRGAKEDYRRLAVSTGLQIHKEAFDEAHPFTDSVVHIIGKPPFDEMPVIAMQQGNHWMLGLTEIEDAKVLQAAPSLRARMKAPDPDFSPTALDGVFTPED